MDYVISCQGKVVEASPLVSLKNLDGVELIWCCLPFKTKKSVLKQKIMQFNKKNFQKIEVTIDRNRYQFFYS